MSIRLILFTLFCFYIIKKSFKGTPTYLAVLLIFLYFAYPEKYIWSINELRIVFMLNIILLFCILHHKRHLFHGEDTFGKLMILMFLSVLISALFTPGDHTISWNYAILFLKMTFFWFMLRACLDNESEISIFLWGCLVSVAFLSLWGIQQYLLGNIRLEGFGGGQIMGSNQIAAAMVWALPIAYFNFFNSKSKARWLALFCSVCILGGIVCTQSRQAVLAVLICAPFFLIAVRSKKTVIAFILLILLLGSAFVPTEFYERMETVKTYEEDASAQGRIEQWVGAYQMFKDYPIFGVGGKNYYTLAHNYVEFPRVTHNTFFQILSEEGLIGIVIFVIMYFLAMKQLYSTYNKFKTLPEGEFISRCAIISFTSMVGVLVTMFFQNKAEHEFVYWPIAVAAVLPKILQQKSETVNATGILKSEVST